ncbi:MAG: DUF1828 domain-containing protein [Bdellovibrionales bacterium]|nr:DUF1828 domain-containing protein [Bdellovibrionales bacterium]
MKMLDTYLAWLKSNYTTHEIDGWTEVITPFLDKNNDHIQVYVRERAGKIVVTDDGQTFSNLNMSGFSPTERRLEIMATIFRGFNIDWTEDSKIELTCEKSEFAQRFHSLMQTIISTDNLGYLTRENVKSMFMEDVAALLRDNEVTYHANQEVKGRSGLAVNFPFYIPAHKQFPSTHIQLINQPKANLKPFLFEWSDTEESRGNTKSIALINDANIQPTSKALSAFEKYEVTPFLWSKKDSFIDELAS